MGRRGVILFIMKTSHENDTTLLARHILVRRLPARESRRQLKWLDTRTEILLSRNQFQHAFLHPHAVIWLSVPLYAHSIFIHSPAPVCLSVRLLLLTCRHMLLVNRGSLTLWWIPTWCFGRRWTSINIIHLTWMDTDYFKVEQPKWIATDVSI